ncbi:hypothetical protein F8M41_009636 [Gigaspora margarita]|uniref:Uncharacterized protein n=1 Tax=Gigaspora margarita TaxID=4874 RepID=A0A8H3X4M9_GIGMA|nr:hypothetical protein F8M41_009636 [Gigaspora margarita]
MVRLEADNLKEKLCAKIYDSEFYNVSLVKTVFKDLKANSPITSIKECHIIISEFSFRFIKDSSIKSQGYDCFLNIERFKYSR